MFKEMDLKEANRIGKFLRIRTSLDLTKPLKRGSKLHFQGKDIWVDYKYERLPNFCFVCGRIGHQMRDCEDTEENDQEGYNEVEEKDQAFGPWLRASPLPKITYELGKESSSSACSKSLLQKIGSIKFLGGTFDNHNMGKLKKEISRLEEKMNDQSLWSGNDEDRCRFKRIEKEHGELLKLQETMWRQRSRAVWLRDGDRNTKFFHNKASQRAKVNDITKIKDEDGVWWRGDEHIESVLINYFDDLFSSSNPSSIEETCEVVRGKLSEEHKTWCEMVYTREDVTEAINHMHPLKAPRLDGLPSLFFQKYWHIVRWEVQDLVLKILNDNEDPHEINKTFLVLIPKGKNPSSPKDFRPISLCNVVMKNVTKVIANRLKHTLGDVIDIEQSAFCARDFRVSIHLLVLNR